MNTLNDSGNPTLTSFRKRKRGPLQSPKAQPIPLDTPIMTVTLPEPEDLFPAETLQRQHEYDDRVARFTKRFTPQPYNWKD